MYIYVNVYDKRLRTTYQQQMWELARQRYRLATGHDPKNDPAFHPMRHTPVSSAAFQKVLGQFVRWLATVYALEIIEAIESQSYQHYWEPLTPEYAAWKKRHGYDPRTWIQTGFLENQIDAYLSGSKGAWVVGIRPRVMYPGTDLSVLQVAKWMEFGTRNMPARPVFGPVQRRISRNITRYFQRFLNETGIQVP